MKSAHSILEIRHGTLPHCHEKWISFKAPDLYRAMTKSLDIEFPVLFPAILSLTAKSEQINQAFL